MASLELGKHRPPLPLQIMVNKDFHSYIVSGQQNTMAAWRRVAIDASVVDPRTPTAMRPRVDRMHGPPVPHPLSATCSVVGTLTCWTVRKSASRSAQKDPTKPTLTSQDLAIFDLYQQQFASPVLSCSFSCARHVVALPLVHSGSDRGLGVDDPENGSRATFGVADPTVRVP